MGARVLVLKKRWLQLILSGEKTVEIRGQSARQGHTWLATGATIYAGARVCCVKCISLAEFQQMSEEHRLQYQSLPYKKTYALSLDTARELPAPVGFHKKWGAIGWSKVRCSRAELPPACKKASKALKPRRAGRRKLGSRCRRG